MLELLTLYAHSEHMSDPDYHVGGMIKEITTNRNPEYSHTLRVLIRECVRPDPGDRIELDVLQNCIKTYRDRAKKVYDNLSNRRRAKFESESHLYYVKNEINNMPPGPWKPAERHKNHRRPDQFPDDYTVEFPHFSDMPSYSHLTELDGNDGNLHSRQRRRHRPGMPEGGRQPSKSHRTFSIRRGVFPSASSDHPSVILHS